MARSKHNRTKRGTQKQRCVTHDERLNQLHPNLWGNLKHADPAVAAAPVVAFVDTPAPVETPKPVARRLHRKKAAA